VIYQIAKMRFERLKRLSNFVESIRDSLIFSTPDILDRRSGFMTIMRWAYSIGCYREDSGTSQWKKLGSLIKWLALRSETARPENPTDLPGFGDQKNPEEFPLFWCHLCPWLRTIAENGAQTKLDLARVMHLTSSRGLPPGDAETRSRSLAKHRETLASVPVEEPDRSNLLRELARLVGSKLYAESTYRSNGHLSLTTSSSFDFLVKEGGRASEISEKFRDWLTFVPSKTIEGTTLLGRDYTELCGFPRWMTVARVDYEDFLRNLPHDDDGAIHPCVQPGESRQDTFFDIENFCYEDPIYALDEATGYQLHQWAVDELLVSGILTGDRHDPTSIRLASGVLPLVRRSTIGEPGAKSRVVTIAEACITIFLQPFSHHIGGWLRNHPSAAAGFTRAAQGFEYAKSIHWKEHPAVDPEVLWMLSSDLTTATDFCVHSYSRAMLDGLFTGLHENHEYHRLCGDLLCSGRQVFDGLETWESSRGILMGDPGAKVVLTMHNLCAELEALLRYRSDAELSNLQLLERARRMVEIPGVWWRCFACSGDDHIAVGPKSYLRLITEMHARNGMSVSWPQNFISSVGAIYCEEFLLIQRYDSKRLFNKRALWQLDYESHIHVDAIKLRLLSPCSKEHEGKDEPNPSIGKSHQLRKVLKWLEKPLGELRRLASWRFSDRFSAFLPKTYQRFLPVKLGGLEVPGWHIESEDVQEELLALDGRLLNLIGKVLSGLSTPLDKRVLSSFASDARARGVDSDAIMDSVRDLLSNEVITKAITLDQLQSVISVEPAEFRNWNFRRKMHEAKLHGFLSINDAINVIERPYIFRDLLFPEMSIKHGYKPYFTQAYEAKSWYARISKFSEMLDLRVQETEENLLTADHIVSIADGVTGGDYPGFRSEMDLLIPSRVVQVESRPQLRTPY